MMTVDELLDLLAAVPLASTVSIYAEHCGCSDRYGLRVEVEGDVVTITDSPVTA